MDALRFALRNRGLKGVDPDAPWSAPKRLSAMVDEAVGQSRTGGTGVQVVAPNGVTLM